MNATLISLLFIIAAAQPHAVSIEEFLEKECNKGVEKDCEELADLKLQLVKQERLQTRAVLYGQRINGNGPMVDEKTPNLEDAYPVVMQDHLDSETAAGETLSLDQVRLPSCANHYHNHWVNKKLWWPTDDEHKPDWASIYVFIVDHYYGFCLKS
ncbi:MAG: hypothetical protein ACI9ZT_000206 [Gammaproteobacteria bacterium]|jgi:hypothetical protein